MHSSRKSTISETFDIVIFGGSGDLSLRKLLPALYRGRRENKISKDARIIVTCRNDVDYDAVALAALQEHLARGEFSKKDWCAFKKNLIQVKLDISKMDDAWAKLNTILGDQPGRTRVFYLAIPPIIFGVCCQHLAKANLINRQSRLVVEKPLGYDAASANEINANIAQYFDEKAIYRIDHYLGKETVQNLMALRFTNLVFAQLWDAKSIDHVQISIAETIGLEGRAGFYNEAGALRDMVQSHLLQLLCLIAMEPPNKLSADSIRAEKLKVLGALRPLAGTDVKKHTVRGQYVAGGYNGTMVPGYFEDLGSTDSLTETFVALRVFIDNWRWAQVPFYLRTGKRMKAPCAEIIIQFKDVPHRVYEERAGPLSPNRLVIRLQPDESIQMNLMSKNLATLDMQLQPATLNLNFSDTYTAFQSDAYKRLILDAAQGNPSLFIHRDEVESAWAWIDPIIEGWRATDADVHLYRAGSWGPDEADGLLTEDGRYWFNAGAGQARQ